MANPPDWEKLSDALERVMLFGLSEDEAKSDICNAIADRKINFRPSIEFITRGLFDQQLNERFAREYLEFWRLRFEGEKRLLLPPQISPVALNWTESRFVAPREFDPVLDGIPQHQRLGMVGIELFRADVTKVLIAPPNDVNDQENVQSNDAPEQRFPTEQRSEGGRSKRSSPKREQALKALNEIYLNGIPGPDIEPDARLVEKASHVIGQKLGKEYIVSPDTILRAAGRRLDRP